mmetsp:Transcript_40440/g.63140  ORF Transcript_40440/g.63140 Transcript_40440/m.63140 type:complete len:380 (+) Transcript_40440:1-1140(+)
MNCLSHAFVCPSAGGYRCYQIELDMTFAASSTDSGIARITMESRDLGLPDLDVNFRFGRQTATMGLLSFQETSLRMRNATHKTSEICSYVRPMHRVNMDGTHDVAVEMLMPYTFLATSSLEFNLRVRLRVVADPQFSAFGLEFRTRDERRKLIISLASIAEVDEDHVTFLATPDFGYLPVTECNQLPECDLEMQVRAQTKFQMESGELWAEQLTQRINEGEIRTLLWRNDLTAEAFLNEAIFRSPQVQTQQTCPASPRSRIVPETTTWQSGAGTEYGNSIAGFGGIDSAYCLHRNGAIDGDSIDYQDAYTVDFGIMAILVRQSETIDLSQYQAEIDEAAAATNNITIGNGTETGGAMETKPSSWLLSLLLIVWGLGLRV